MNIYGRKNLKEPLYTSISERLSRVHIPNGFRFAGRNISANLLQPVDRFIHLDKQSLQNLSNTLFLEQAYEHF